MTEESVHETEDGEIEIHCHTLPWRSQSNNEQYYNNDMFYASNFRPN